MKKDFINTCSRSLGIFLPLLFFISVSNGQSPVANFTANIQSGCSPLIINFQDLSTGNPISWNWDFGNGNTSSLQNPSATYFTPGTYTVRLTATNNSGSNTLSRTAYITVNENPVVNFSANTTTGCFPFIVQFTDASTAGTGNTNISWNWDFGNGVTSTLQNPTVTYTTAGVYTVTLTVVNDKGCNRTVVKPNYINVTVGVVAGFTNTIPTVCRPPADINFTNTSTGPGVLSYLWDFGDGNTSIAQNPIHTYTTAGSYIVTLTATSSAGCVDTYRITTPIVIGGIITSFNAPFSACTQEVFSLTNTSSPVPISSFWNFGDGNTANTINTSHSYVTPGLYTIRLFNTYSNCIDSMLQNITINPQPVADFSSPDTIRCEPPLTSNFTDLTTGGATAWQWNFGDGGTSTLQNPSHTFITTGSFTVTLIATNAFGCSDTIVKTNYIRIQRASISIPLLPIRACVPLTISPIALVTSLDAVTSWLWDFGDGVTSPLQFPTHIYPVQGTFTVKLFITTSTGCTDSLVLDSAVRVGTKPIANFTAAPNPVCAKKPISFTDLSVPANEWFWQFGDGGTSIVRNPIYAYQDTGYFDVTLIATNNGCPDTIVIPNFIQVLPPIARFTPVPNCNNRLQFSFTDQSVVPLSWSWEFGDGATSTLQNPVHTYASFSSYNVLLAVTNGACTDSLVQTIKTIQEFPDFTAPQTTLCRTGNVNFTATNINIANISSYTWNFGDGFSDTVTTNTILHSYTLSGTYTVRLITTDLNGCTDTVTRMNYITIIGPTANFNAINSSGCAGLTTTFNDLSTTDGTNAITNWQWNFGDGNIQSYTSPPFNHLYPNPGTYSVGLIITDAVGCKDSITLLDTINTTDPVPDFNTADSLTCPGAPVVFNNISTGNTLTYNWDFGDGNTSTSISPIHNYAVNGIYTIKLLINDLFGCKDSLFRNLYIKVDTPYAAFNVSDSIGSCIPLQVQFTNNSNYFSSVVWDFGDGTSSLTNPVHYFGLPGIYNVKLTVTSPGGCLDSVFKTITIYDTTATRLNYPAFIGCAPLNASFNLITQGVYSYLWDYGDGTTEITPGPVSSHIYQSFGNYIPRVIMQDPSGCLIPVTGIDTVIVLGAEADFGISNNLFCDSAVVNFADSTRSSDPIINYNWSFGDGNTSIQSNPVNNYVAPGLYNINLSVQTQTGCIDTIQKNNFIKIVFSPLIDINGDDEICINESILHSGIFLRADTSSVTWSWSFPNGNNSTLQNPALQTYTSAGNFNVTAIATNSSGCKDTMVNPIIVNPLPTATLPGQMTVQNGFPVTIPATYSPNVISWQWFPPTGLSCSNCPTPDAGPKLNTLYNVLYTDQKGCQNTGSVEVIVICKNGNLFIPNTFSPNGDGNNDRFYPRGKGLERVKTLRIFNRWGEIVFEKNNIPVNDAASGWDGTYKGKKLADVYIYQAEVFCENGDLIRINGNIALIL